MNRSKAAILLTAATVSLAYSHSANAETQSSNPYVAGDMHNHNTCTDGSTAAGYEIDRSIAGPGNHPLGGQNFELDWFTMGNHGGSGNRDCRFSDASANIPGDNVTTTWPTTLGQTIQGITINSLKGTPNGDRMWRWQSVAEVEYPIIVNRAAQYTNRTLIEGIEWVVPGHEHADVAVISGQNPAAGGNADKMAEFEFRFDRGDTDAIGPVDGVGAPIWTGKDNVNNTGTAGHGKTVAGVAWLQANYPLTSYAIPTHTERAGPFDPTRSRGYNIEHFRDMNNAGPTVAFGIEAPGHGAEGGIGGGAGSYGTGAVGGGTYGLWGIYNAKVGGLWDGLLAEGRNMFLYNSSDWHSRGSFGARDSATTADFWPGEFTKLYVPNASGFNNQAVIDGMRSGNSYSVNGDLIGPNMVFNATYRGATKTMGETLVVKPGQKIIFDIQFTMPKKNHSPYSFNNPLLSQIGLRQPLNKPVVDHIDLIISPITGVVDPSSPNYAVPNAGGTAGAAIVYNPNAQVLVQRTVARLSKQTQADGSVRVRYRFGLKMGTQPFYIRMRGTNLPVALPNATDLAGNPLLDVTNTNVSCLDPACPAHLETVAGVKRVTNDVQAWSNLWFYTNPIFFRPTNSPKLLVETNAELAESLKGASAAPTKSASK